MSSVEERLGRDIAAVTGGVVVTESELKDARDAVQDRIEFGRQRIRRRTIAGLVAAAVVIPIVGVAVARSLGGDETAPAGPVKPTPSTIRASDDLWLTGDPPTRDLVKGLWREDNGTMSIRFSPSGAVSFDNNGRVFGAPQFTGTYEIVDGVITLHVDGGTAGCAGQTFAMRASVIESGLMHFNPTQPGSGRCLFVRNQWGAWEQILPPGSAIAGLKFPETLSWKPWPGSRSLPGMWAAEGGGYVLEIDRDGSYYVLDESANPIDRGRWSYRDSELILTSSADSVACRTGDQAVLSDLQLVNPGTPAMQWTVKKNTCGGPWATKDWFRVPDQTG